VVYRLLHAPAESRPRTKEFDEDSKNNVDFDQAVYSFPLVKAMTKSRSCSQLADDHYSKRTPCGGGGVFANINLRGKGNEFIAENCEFS